MPLYPTVPRRRAWTVAGDLGVIALVLVFAWLGVKVHDRIAELRSLGQGVSDAGTAVERTSRDTGNAIRSGFGTAADAVDGAPVVGGAVSGALRSGGDSAAGAVASPGRSAGAEIVQAGREGEERALSAARLLGWVTFLVPTLLLLSRALPPRVQQVRRLSVAGRVLRPGADPERVRVLAQRAAFSLPYGTLLAHTDDPVGDLVAGRHEPLLRALAEHDGVRIDTRSEATERP